LIVAAYFLQEVKNLDKIDIHEHIKDIGQAERVLKIMDDLHIEKMVLLGTPSLTFHEKTDKFEKYDEHNEKMLEIKEKYPDRFSVFVTINPEDKDAAKKLENYSIRGASGLKLYHGVIPSLGHINSSEMYEVYENCKELNLPVIIHVELLNATQMEEFRRVIEDFPDVKFNCPHLCGSATRLEILSKLLDSYPNLTTDMGPWHRVGKYAVNNTQQFREFFIKYQDRIMFATDIVLDETWESDSLVREWFECGINLLEKKYFTCYKEEGRILEGLNLPTEVLEKIYLINPTKFVENI
jgi:predicted TIM-barrel fold metal-dependent hydrolase